MAARGLGGKWGEDKPECVIHRDGPWHDAGAYFYRACGACGRTVRMRAHPAVETREATKHLEAILAQTDLEGA